MKEFKCLFCGDIVQRNFGSFEIQTFCFKCQKETKHKELIKDTQLCFDETKKELDSIVQELRELTQQISRYMRYFYQMQELVSQARYLEDRIEELNKQMIYSFNEVKP